MARKISDPTGWRNSDTFYVLWRFVATPRASHMPVLKAATDFSSFQPFAGAKPLDPLRFVQFNNVCSGFRKLRNQQCFDSVL